MKTDTLLANYFKTTKHTKDEVILKKGVGIHNERAKLDMLWLYISETVALFYISQDLKQRDDLNTRGSNYAFAVFSRPYSRPDSVHGNLFHSIVSC